MIVISTQPDSSAPITSFEPQLAALCPETARILLTARLTVHPRVTAITLHGSRGPAGGYRPDSDVDLCLIVETTGVTERGELATLLRSALHTTLEYWQGAVEADLAAAYDRQGCGLSCFERATWDEAHCTIGGQDCFGLYKIQRGYDGFVEQGVELPKMFPCMVVWQRDGGAPLPATGWQKASQSPQYRWIARLS